MKEVEKNEIKRLSDRLDLIRHQMKGLGHLQSFNESSEDVSEQYFDTQSRLKTQQAKMERLTALMETFMAGLLADPRTQPFFANADQVRVKRQLTEQFCVILGGDCTYTGRDMRTSHAGQNIDRGHFNALVEVLQVAMDKHDVPFRAQNKLLAILAPMHREVITR